VIVQDEIKQMEWRCCASYPDYEVSECGDIRRATGSRTRLKGWRLRGFIDADGYLRYALIDANGEKQVVIAHRLVAETFIGPAPSPVHEVAHNNGSRVSNHYSNLRWATRKENDDDTVIHGTARVGKNNGNAKLSEQDVHDIRRIYREIKNRERSGKISDLARSYGIHHATVVGIATGKSWGHLQ
jgi:hypothetical protein